MTSRQVARTALTVLTVSVLAGTALAGCSSGSSSASGATASAGGTGSASGTASSAGNSSATPGSTGGSSSAGSGASTSASATPTKGMSALPPATGSPSPTSGVSIPAQVTLVLQAEGLAYVVPPSSVRQVPFGTSDLTVLKNLLLKGTGAKSVQDVALPECGQGPRRSLTANGVQLLLDGTTFVGWSDDGKNTLKLTTLDGLGVGSTLADLKKNLPGVQTMDDSLGPEFVADSGFGGMLDGLKPTSKATFVYAGETCFFR